jgi:hypothetical protein
MRAIVVALFTLPLGAGLLSPADARAAATHGYSAAAMPAPPPSGAVRLADGAKGGDKFMSGRAGGRYGIGGPDCKTCKKKKK